MCFYAPNDSHNDDIEGVRWVCWMQTVLSKVGAALASVALFASPMTYMTGALGVHYLYY